MSVTNAIRSVVNHITRKLVVYEYWDGEKTLLTVNITDAGLGVLWVGAWVELFGANESKRYQVTELNVLPSNYKRYIVTLDTSEELNKGVSTLALLLDYQFGHSAEIQQTLAEQSRDVAWKAKQYPKLILFLDIEEVWKEKGDVSLNFAICTTTNKDFKALDREIESFDKVLYPLYRLFVYELSLAPGIEVDAPIEHRKWDRYFWGSQPTPDQNVFSALLDAIEINNLQAKINKECLV